jgi:hypothetical protein
MYEHIKREALASGRYGSRAREVAARTVNKFRARSRLRKKSVKKNVKKSRTKTRPKTNKKSYKKSHEKTRRPRGKSRASRASQSHGNIYADRTKISRAFLERMSSVP